jgi:hypothetical protein
MIREDGARSLLLDLDTAIRELVLCAGHDASIVRLTACYHNLLRRWADMVGRCYENGWGAPAVCRALQVGISFLSAAATIGAVQFGQPAV